uniref:LCP family protein n=1 Tax=Dietzia sp. SYD-A1 TaxID=2780141 RepID=UPI002814F48C
GYGPADARRPGRAPGRRRLGPMRILGLVLVLILTLGVVSVLWADSKLQRIDALPDYPGRGGNTPGSITLLVGTDSREGLTPEQQAQLSTGSESDAGGKRTDTMMLVYTPRDGGRTMLISLPRDLLVDIPDYGQNKLNAAYTFGGPPLLTRTLEEQTGMRIDHYAEIGFGGFAGIVDAVGGVDICIEEPINDPLAGLDLAAGCQTLAGPQALGFVRTRYGFAEQDLQRVRNQRQFLGALMSETMSPGNLLNPFTAVSLIDSASEAVTVDSGDHIWNLAWVMWKLRGDPLTVTAPYDGMDSGSVGSYLVWGPNTTGFFDAVASGRTPPQEYLDAGP